MGTLAKIGSSALAVAIVGAVLAFVFAQVGEHVSRSWQQEDKRLEIRTALVRRVAETNADFIGAIRLRGMGAADLRAFDAAYRQWAVASSSIGSELAAYVGGEATHEQWRNFRTNMGYVYYLFRASTPERRTGWLEKIAGYTTPGKQSDQYEVIEKLSDPPPSTAGPGPVYETALRELILKLEQRSDMIVRSILESPTNV